jgi:hypothetical protein
VADTLKNLDLVLEVSPVRDGAPAYVPAKPLDQMTVGHILKLLRQARLGAVNQVMSGAPALAELLRRLAAGPGPSPWDDLTLKELVLQASPSAP